MTKPKRLLVVLGNEFRSDDGVGLVVLRDLQKCCPEGFEYLAHNGDPTDLMERWQERQAWLIDALAPQPGDSIGDIKELNPLAGDLLEATPSPSSHAASLAEALAWGRSLGKLPQSLKVYGVVGGNFAAGTQLSAAVNAAVPKVVEKILQVRRSQGHA